MSQEASTKGRMASSGGAAGGIEVKLRLEEEEMSTSTITGKKCFSILLLFSISVCCLNCTCGMLKRNLVKNWVICSCMSDTIEQL